MRSDTSNPFVLPSAVWLPFTGFSLVATLVGCWVAASHGAPGPVWLLNLAGWSLGAALAATLSRGGLKIERWWPLIALAGLALTFLSAGLSGVHRWINLGPVRVNAAELVLPSLIVTLAAGRDRRLLSFAVSLSAMAALALQPDASQATAFAGGSIVVMFLTHRLAPRWILAALLLAAIAVVSCFRPDSLDPVPEVEGIVRLAAAVSPAAAGLTILALAGAVLTPVFVARFHDGDQDGAPVKAAACGLTTYLALSALAPAFGAFPVPLVGMGVSPILGVWLGFGCLMALCRRNGASNRGGPP
jgi:cell division protein FtsW (lipid II flippase)